MAQYHRVPGGEKNAKTGTDWTKPELEKVLDLYLELDGRGIHERNPQIHDLAKKLGRTVRSVENQLLGFQKIDVGDTGRQNYNRLIPVIWQERLGTTRQKNVDDLHFRVSSALKDIIGRDLITDEYIAVFELVKNSFDAGASRVDISFVDTDSKKAKIVVKDNGKGMDLTDLKDRWLFVAYSAKREGTEDDNLDYRDNIQKGRTYAGAKGIGRFSCDKLGSKLLLETTKKSPTAKTHVLLTDWSEFERNLRTEFFEIGMDHKIRKKSAYGLTHGTVLEISELRTVWDREKILRLKRSLAKLINPNQGRGDKNFRIFIHSELEKKSDSEIKRKAKEDGSPVDERLLVNAEVKNFVFETLGLKTTRIISSLSEDGETMTTELVEGETLIYRIKEKNVYPLLDSVSCTLYYLNRAAKYAFAATMGVPSKDYGHVFLYKNGFRIYPYGEVGEDPLKIDVRKAQGQRRHLGTRELMGQIEIFSDTDRLRETSSRGDGLIKTETYFELERFFLGTLRRLEKYVVDVQQWGLSIEDDDEQISSRVAELLYKLTDSDNILEFEYAPDIDEILERSQSNSALKVVENIKKIAIESENEKLLKEVVRASKRFVEIQEARLEAEQEARKERARADEAIREKVEKESENLFLRSIKSQDFEEIVSFMHHIGISASNIDILLKGVYRKVSKGESIAPKHLREVIEEISFENRKVMSIAKFATKANFKLFTDEASINIIEYVKEYINNVVRTVISQRLKLQFANSFGSSVYEKMIKPIELNILIDNLISNSTKASANNIAIDLRKSEDGRLLMEYSDDGVGIPTGNIPKIFDFGFTTTSGSGLGLFHVKKIIKDFGGEINVESIPKKKTTFSIKI